MDTLSTAGGWWLLRSLAAGTLLMALALVAMRLVKQPARRQRLGDFGLAASLVAALVCLAAAPAVTLHTEAAPAEPGPALEPEQIHIQDGQVSNTYTKLADVPAQYRAKVEHLIQASSGTAIRK